MYRSDTVLVTDDPEIAQRFHERYPDACRQTLPLSEAKNLFISIDMTTLRLSSWSEGGRSLTVLGHNVIPATDLCSVVTRAPTVRHLNVSPSRLPNAQWIIAATHGSLRIQATATGLSRIYFVRDGDRFCASNRASALAAIYDRDVDISALSLRLLHPWQYPLTLLPCWSGIQQLSPDSYLEVSHDRGLRIQRWWEPPAPYLSLEACASATASAIVNSIAGGVAGHSTVSCDISGGLDSGAVTAVAAHVAAQRLDLGIHGWTAATEDPFNADTAWAQRLAGAVALDKHQMIQVGEMPCYFDDLDATIAYDLDEPSVAAIASRRLTYITDMAAQAGSEAHLCGFGGDEMFTTMPAAGADELCGAPFAAARNLLAHRALHRWPLGTLVQQLARRRRTYQNWLATGSISSAAEPFRHPAVGWGHTAGVPRWMTAEGSRLAHECIASFAETAMPLATRPGRHFQQAHIYGHLAQVGSVVDIVAQSSGIPLIAPLCDPDVMAAALSVNSWVRSSPYDFKPVLKEAVRPFVAEGVLVRNSKGGEDTAAARGLERNLPVIRDLLCDSVLADCGLVDKRVLHEVLKSARNSELMSGLFQATLTAELWLRSVKGRAGR